MTAWPSLLAIIGGRHPPPNVLRIDDCAVDGDLIDSADRWKRAATIETDVLSAVKEVDLRGTGHGAVKNE